jgi:hypothetical protein
LTKFKQSKINIYLYIVDMKTISIFILLIYWSILIFSPIISKDIEISKAKFDNGKIIE